MPAHASFGVCVRACLRQIKRFAMPAALCLLVAACGGGKGAAEYGSDSAGGTVGQKSRTQPPERQALPEPKPAVSSRLSALILGSAGQVSQGPSIPAQPARQVEVPEGVVLPEVAGLARGVSALPSGDSNCFGEEYDTNLPARRIQPTVEGINMLPNGTAFSNTAFAIYRFNLPGFDRTAQLETYWTQPPVAGELFYAIADFGSNSWRWVEGDSAEPVLFPEGGDYLSDADDVLVVVLLRGVFPAGLGALRFGGNSPPTAVIHSSLAFAEAPFIADLTGAFSSDAEGGVVRYEWDLDGDGSFEQDGGAEAATMKSLDNPGTQTVSLRVTDSEGSTGTASYQLTADGPGYDEVEPNEAELTEDDVLPDGSFQDWDGSLGVGGYDGDELDGYIFNVSTPRWLHFRLTSASSDFLALAVLNGEGEIMVQNTDLAGDVRLPVRIAEPGLYAVVMQVTPETAGFDYQLSCEVNYDSGYFEVEDNDLPGQADSIPQDGIEGFSGNLGEPGYDGDGHDLTRLSGQAGTGCRVTLRSYSDKADIDFEVLAEDAQTLIASSTTPFNFESSVFTFPQDGEYLIGSFLKPEAEVSGSVDYLLDVTYLGLSPVAALSVTPESGMAPQTITLDFSGSEVAPDEMLDYLGLDWNNDGEVDAVSDSLSPFQVVIYQPGSHEIAVVIAQSDGQTATAVDTLVLDGFIDEVEPNDAIETAQALPAGNFSSFMGSIGPGINRGGLDDFYSYLASADGTLTLTVNYEIAMPRITLNLLDSMGIPVDIDSDADGNLEVSVAVASGQQYYLLVFCDDNTNLVQGYAVSGGVT